MGLGAKQHWCAFYGQINCWGLFQRTRQPKLSIAAKQNSREGWVNSPERGLMEVLNLGEGNGGIPKLFLHLKILFSVVHIMPNFKQNIPTSCLCWVLFGKTVVKTVQLFWRMRVRKYISLQLKINTNKGRVTNSSHGASAFGSNDWMVGKYLLCSSHKNPPKLGQYGNTEGIKAEN